MQTKSFCVDGLSRGSLQSSAYAKSNLPASAAFEVNERIRNSIESSDRKQGRFQEHHLLRRLQILADLVHAKLSSPDTHRNYRATLETVPSKCIRSQIGGTPALMHSLQAWSFVAHGLTNPSFRSVTPHHHMQELVSLSRSLTAAECSLFRLYCAVQESMASYPCGNQLLGLGHIYRDYIACPYLVHDNQLELLPLI